MTGSCSCWLLLHGRGLGSHLGHVLLVLGVLLGLVHGLLVVLLLSHGLLRGRGPRRHHLLLEQVGELGELKVPDEVCERVLADALGDVRGVESVVDQVEHTGTNHGGGGGLDRVLIQTEGLDSTRGQELLE